MSAQLTTYSRNFLQGILRTIKKRDVQKPEGRPEGKAKGLIGSIACDFFHLLAAFVAAIFGQKSAVWLVDLQYQR